MSIHIYDGFWRGILQYLLYLLFAFPYGLMFYCTIDRFLQVRKTWWARAAILAAGMVTAHTVIFIADAFNILFLLIFFAAALWFCTQGSRSARFSMILIVYPMAMAFNAVMDNLILRFPGSKWHYILFHMSCRFAFWGILLLLSRTFVREDDGRPMLSSPMWVLLDLLALTPAAAVFVLVIFPSHRYMSDTLVEQFRTAAMVLLPFVIISSFGLLCAVTVLSRHEALRRKETLWGMRSLYYQNLEQEQTQVRRLRHDMANHLQALAGLLDTPEQAREYLASLSDKPGLTASRKFCENPVVNTVLAGKLALMEEKQITADFAVALPKELPLSPPDLCALFANALDNAIEACEKLDNPQERTVRVRARADKGLLMAQITNRTGGPVSATLETTKSDKSRHGYGLSILREIAARAGGTCSIEQRPGVFTLMITVPMQTENSPAASEPRKRKK